MKPDVRRYVAEAAPGSERAVVAEYLQARVLQHIIASEAMVSIAFMGGTALRFLYGTPRYSEDLDFALESHRERYDFEALLGSVERGFLEEGYGVALKVGRGRGAVDKAFVKFRGLLHEVGLSPLEDETLSVKIEVDTNPPPGAGLAVSEVDRYVPLRLHHHDRASLFAGKIAAVLTRPYTKGRDLYDLMWYLRDPDWPGPNLALLSGALVRSGRQDIGVAEGAWREAVLARLADVDWPKVTREVVQFLERPQEADLLEHATFERLLRHASL